MTNTKRMSAATLALAAIAAMSACAGDQPTPTSAPSSSSTTTATPRPSTTSLSPAEQEAKDVAQAIPRFWAVLDELAADPNLSLDKLATVSRDASINTWRQMLTRHRVRQEKQIGKAVVATSTVKPNGASKFIVVACIDVSKVNLVDKAGKSVVAANRPPRVQYQYTVEKTSGGGFYVLTDKAVETC